VRSSERLGKFLLSWIKREEAARALRHAAYPLVVWSNCLERYATGAKECPMLCLRTPRANPCLPEMYRKEG
jgi:hypothetical protein